MVKRKLIQSLQRGILILEELGRRSQGMGLGAIADKLDLKKSTAHHLLGTLIEMGFVKQSPVTKRYSLGPGFLDLAHRATSNKDLVIESEPLLRDLAEKSGEVAHLLSLDHNEVVYLQRVENPNATRGLQMASYVGMRNYAHSSSGGKVLLAHIESSQVEKIIAEKGLPKTTENTIGDPDKLCEELELIRRQGFAVDNEENEIGVRCVGAPVMNASGQVVAAVSISGPAVRVTCEIIESKMVDLVKGAAMDLSRRLGYRD